MSVHRAVRARVGQLLAGFDATLPLARASTPPKEWYSCPDLFAAERSSIFAKNWCPVGRTAQLRAPGDYLTGELHGEPFVVVNATGTSRRQLGKPQILAFRNVCRHKAMRVASGTGNCQFFRCPYHGWEYALTGRLFKGKSLKGIEDFKSADFGLTPLRVETCGPFVWLCQDPETPSLHEADPGLSSLHESLQAARYEELRHVRTVEFNVDCNWKVFVDNYLDGGYHVPVAHPALTQGVDMDSYETTLYGRHSIQTVGAAAGVDDVRTTRGQAPIYAWVYPNFMINRYGPWMDTNTVWPTGPTSCRVSFDYYLEEGPFHADEKFLEESLAASRQVQDEDEELCLGVQRGMQSVGYTTSRYALCEKGEYHFHQLVAEDLDKWVGAPCTDDL